MAPETRRKRAARRRDSAEGSVAGAGRGKRKRTTEPSRASVDAAKKAVRRTITARGKKTDEPQASGPSSFNLSERAVLSALCERAVSNSVPEGVRNMYPAEASEEFADDGCSERTSEGTSPRTSSLRARRSLPGLRLPNEVFDGERGDERELEIESGFLGAADYQDKLPADGWIQPCFACGRWTWQNVSLGGMRVYRCGDCAASFRARAAELAKTMPPGENEAGGGLSAGAVETDESKGAVLASLLTKLRAVVDQVGGEHLKGSITDIDQ
jgi:hypothetical protein